MSNETALISLLLDTANQLIAESLQKISHEEPEKHKAVIEFAVSGAIPRLTIETHPGLTTIGLTLNRDGGGVNVFLINTVRTQTSLH